MDSIWVLSVKTSLPDVCESVGDIKTDFFAFESFDKAKQALKSKLKDFAFSENSMFDGNGNMIYFKEYLNGAFEPEDGEEVDKDTLTKVVLLKIYDAVKAVFEGKKSDISEFDNFYTDSMIAVEIKDDVMTIRGDDDGPCNGYEPQFILNMFDMSEEKDYFLYVNDRFGQDGSTSELYIDLKKVEII